MNNATTLQKLFYVCINVAKVQFLDQEKAWVHSLFPGLKVNL